MGLDWGREHRGVAMEEDRLLDRDHFQVEVMVLDLGRDRLGEALEVEGALEGLVGLEARAGEGEDQGVDVSPPNGGFPLRHGRRERLAAPLTANGFGS